MNYIKEIDGLRAIAVLSVLFFHVEYPFFAGGFVGVDVFFVISGYLITGIILHEIDAGKFSIKRFYERRIRRIAPALTATLLGCTLFLVILPPGEAAAIRNALFAGLFSVSNFVFYATTDYFSDNSFNPLLHTWSLSVEEQFYVVLPPTLLLLSLGSQHKRLACMALLAIASLFAAQFVVTRDQSAAFYLPWLRAWELLAGSLLAAWGINRIPAPVKIASMIVGLASIAVACLTYTDRMQFPGLSALLPVLGSCAVIAGTGAQSPVHSLLGSPPMRFIGKISYSLYLVHWPIVCFVAYFQSITPKAQSAICLISVALAWLSWRFVENPFRERAHQPVDRKRQQNVFRVFGAAVAALSLTFVLVGTLGRSLWNSVPEALNFTTYLDYPKVNPQFAANPCFLKPKIPNLEEFAASCLRVDPGKKNVLVIGDSHSVHFLAALRSAHPDVNFLQASASGCKPTLKPRGADYCMALMRFMFDQWLPQSGPEVSTILISAQWQQTDQQLIGDSLAFLVKLGKTPLLIGPSPEFRAKVPLILAYEDILGRSLAASLLKPERSALDRTFRESPAIRTHYVSVIDNLCPAGVCLTRDGAAPLYFDRDHLTVEGARIAIQNLAP